MNRSRLGMAALSAAMGLARAGLTHRSAIRRRSRPDATPSASASPSADPPATAAAAAPEPPTAVVVIPRRTPPRLATQFANSLGLLGVAGLVLTLVLVILDLVERDAELLARPANGRIEEVLVALSGPNWPFISALITLAIWAVFLMWRVPQWQAAARAAAGNVEPHELFEIENAARATFGQILSGVAVLAGLLFAWQQLGNTGDTLRISQEGQITERFTRAIDQLGSDNLTVRLGGIYALERIARDSPTDYPSVMEVLSTFVRTNAPRAAAPATPAAGAATPAVGLPMPAAAARPLAVDVQAALTVITRRQQPWNGPQCLDLSGISLVGLNLTNANLANTCLYGTTLNSATLKGANLSGAKLVGAKLVRTFLDGANLNGADLSQAEATGAILSGASLIDANLQEAKLQFALLQGADLSGARLFNSDLSRAVLSDADVDGADFARANLAGATLLGLDLSKTVHLTAEQIDAALLDRQTTLPPGVEVTPDF